MTGSRAGKVIAESLARMTDPADATRRNTGHQRKGSYIAGDDGTRSDEAVHAEVGAAKDSGIRSDRDATLDYGLEKFIVVIDLGARDLNVGEHAARTAKHAVLQFDPFVDADIILDLATVADADIRPDHDILADGAIATNDAALDNMREMPYASILTNLTAFVDDSGRVRTIRRRLPPREWPACIR